MYETEPNMCYESVNDMRFACLFCFYIFINGKNQSQTGMTEINSWQTYEGLNVTVHSLKEVCKFLLEHGVKYVEYI